MTRCAIIYTLVQKPPVPLGNFHQKQVIWQNSVSFCNPKVSEKAFMAFELDMLPDEKSFFF